MTVIVYVCIAIGILTMYLWWNNEKQRKVILNSPLYIIFRWSGLYLISVSDSNNKDSCIKYVSENLKLIFGFVDNKHTLNSELYRQIKVIENNDEYYFATQGILQSMKEYADASCLDESARKDYILFLVNISTSISKLGGKREQDFISDACKAVNFSSNDFQLLLNDKLTRYASSILSHK